MDVATLVLVHGAWLGGWVWGRVAADLRARGHTVYAPTLTGLGDRRHLLAAVADLETHVTDVTNLLEFEDLQRVTLVAHGYAGAVAQGVAARTSGRIARLAFLDAVVIADGETVLDALGPEAAAALGSRAAEEDGRAVYMPDVGLLLDGLAARDADWVEDRLAPMPAAPYDQAIELPGFDELDLPTMFVKCLRGDPSAGRARAEAAGWVVYEIDGGHLPMIARVEPTAELLDNFVRQPAARYTRAGLRESRDGE